MKWSLAILSLCLFSAIATEAKEPQKKKQKVQPKDQKDLAAWSFDVGGQYTWMHFTTPPTYTGSTGGVMGKITHQKPWSVFGQFRTVYNIGSLSSKVNKSSDREWYNEGVVGYTFPLMPRWTLTPYAGVGLDCLRDNHKAYSTFSAIDLKYRVYYAIGGIDTRYTWNQWYLGAQIDCLPTFSQYLSIKGLSGTAWTLTQRVGWAARIPIGVKLHEKIWLEATPYFRFLPIGSSSVLSLPHRNLMQWGGFLTFRFFI